MIWTPFTPQSTPADRLKTIMDFLCEAIVIQGRELGLAGGLILIIWLRFSRLATRIARILARNPRPRPARPRAPSRPPEPVAPPAYGLPTGFAWLTNTIPGFFSGASIARFELAHLLENPDMIALIAARPSLARLLRPLCHSLGIERPPILRLPEPAEPASPRKKRAKPPDPPIVGILPRPAPFAPGNRFWPPWVKPRKITP